MTSEEVSILRDFGKKAAWILRGMNAGVGDQDGEESDRGDQEGDNAPESGGEDQEEEGRCANATPKEIEDSGDVDLTTADSSRAPEDSEVDEEVIAARQRLLISLGTGLRNGTIAAEDVTRAEAEADEDIDHTGTKPDDDAGRERQRTVDTLAVHATLDTIVTLIGEFYGQRDILEARLLWDEM